ncbi:hypothetical protein [Salinivibrio sharmensis]|nr:hypothetical protein [Salinivibrio sharmensis]
MPNAKQHLRYFSLSSGLEWRHFGGRLVIQGVNPVKIEHIGAD